jgi:hypothetical protein
VEATWSAIVRICYHIPGDVKCFVVGQFLRLKSRTGGTRAGYRQYTLQLCRETHSPGAGRPLLPNADKDGLHRVGRT